MSTRPARNKRMSSKPGGLLNVGYVPTMDCATLIAAKELGMFEHFGIHVHLSREVGWATIREKLLHEELDAVAAHATAMLSIHCGLGVVQRPCLTGLILSVRGSAITLSSELWEMGARDAATAGVVIRNHKNKRRFVFGVVLEYSTQHYLLNRWLHSAGLDPDSDVDIAIIPSALVYENFSKGFLDGYCVAEPWNSAAVKNRDGWIVSTGSEAGFNCPEKVLLVLKDFAEHQPEVHTRLLAALIAAGRFCEEPSNRNKLAAILSRSEYLDVPEDFLTNSLVGPLDSGRGIKAHENFICYDACKVGAPTEAAGRSIMDLFLSFRRNPYKSNPRLDVIRETFRQDIYDEATQVELENTATNLASAAPA